MFPAVALARISMLRNMMFLALEHMSVLRIHHRLKYVSTDDFFIKQNFFFYKNEKAKFRKILTNTLHLETLFTMVATSNGNVSSPKES